MYGVFFSYARSDSEFVLKVAKALRNEGRRIWVDQLDIPKGGRWDDEVEKALKASSCLLVVLSPSSTQSQNVLDEVSFALEGKKVVLPILLQSGSIPFRLKRLQYIDFTGDYDDAYRQLTMALDVLSTPQVGTRRHPPEPVTAELTRQATATGASADAPRRFPQGIAYVLTGFAVLAIGYVLFARMRGGADVVPTALLNAPATRVEPSVLTPVPPVVKAAPQKVDAQDLRGYWRDDDGMLFRIVTREGGGFDMGRIEPPESDPVYRVVKINNRSVEIAFGVLPAGTQQAVAHLELSVDGNILSGLLKSTQIDDTPINWVLRRTSEATKSGEN
jgi:hypothetical protein